MRFDEDGDRLERPSWILIQSMDLIWSMKDEPIGKPTIDSTGKQDDQYNGDNCGKCEDAILDPAEAGRGRCCRFLETSSQNHRYFNFKRGIMVVTKQEEVLPKISHERAISFFHDLLSYQGIQIRSYATYPSVYECECRCG